MSFFTQQNLSGGQNSKTSPLFLANNECELVQNYHMDNLGSLTKRNGIVNLLGQIVNARPILGMYFFNDVQGTDNSNVLVAINNAASTFSDIFRISANTWAVSRANDTAEAEPVFTTFIDYVFRTNGREVMNSSLDLATWGTVNCLATLRPRFCWLWEDRIYAGNDNSPTRFPSRIYWSSLPSGSPLAITWTPATSFADINPDDNDEITWGEPFGSVCLIFKNKGLYRWRFGQVEADKVINVGTPNGRTVKQIHGICFFANEDGVWTMTGAQNYPQIISRKVDDFIKAITDFSRLRAEVDDDHYYLYISDVTVKGIAFQNVMLVYTLSKKTWHIETYPFEIRSMARFQRKTLGTTEIFDSIYLGDDNGFVYRKDIGTRDFLGTTATPINGKVITKEYPLVGFPKDSILDNLYVVSQKGVGTKVNYRINRGDWQAWKDLKERITEGKLSGRAKTLQFSFTDNSFNTSQIEGFSIHLRGEKAVKRE